jgi:hypothetical protein
MGRRTIAGTPAPKVATMGRANDQAPRRRLSLSLRGSLLLVLVLGLWLGWQARRARLQREAVAAVTAYGGFVRYDWELDAKGVPVPDAAPRAPGWLRRAIGDDYFQTVAVADMIHATDRRGMAVLAGSESDALMAKLAALPDLREVYLPGELATDRAMETIGGLKGLRTLMIWEARVTGEGLSRLRRLRGLKALRVSDAGLRDDDLEHLAPLVRLEELDLGRNPITDAGMSHLAGLKSLRFLAIHGTQVTDAGLEQLRGLTSLKELWVADGVTDEGLARFRATMSNLNTVR